MTQTLVDAYVQASAAQGESARMSSGATDEAQEALNTWAGAIPAWLVTERHGCFAITGEPGARHATLVQVSSLTVFTSLVDYWSGATRALAAPSGNA